MRLRSRAGSIVLGVVGAVYAVSALWLLGSTMPMTILVAAMRDYVILAALGVAALIGIWFMQISMSSLHLRLPHFRRHHPGPPHGAALQ